MLINFKRNDNKVPVLD